MTIPFFKPGDTVLVCGEDLPAFKATIRWQSPETCSEHNDPIYRCEFELNNTQFEGIFCQSVLTFPNEN